MKRSLPSVEDSVRILRTLRTKRAPKPRPPVQKQVQPLLKSLQKKFEAMDDGTSALKSRWNEIVGESLGRLCEPVRIIRGRTGGALEIRVAGAYAPLIQHQSAVLIDRINLYLGGRKVERLRLIQGPLTRQAAAPKPAPPRPLSPQDELALQRQVADVSDEKLRAQLLKLGRGVLRRQKNAPQG
ncbi:DciA family protein [Asticcacaulis sp. EMRT-3]|uniref:DUF721 domain-containing protein n=1 Tax=Asticcacaulis sp. EMRT-3 TaxID=3040349 RepID=UPI0024AEC210|nr:DciA family protein [Asticcacaulis sp. EMRT-3]MDI7774058.1 DciA family protein [Asticcacaulis sp. EMRT-3]